MTHTAPPIFTPEEIQHTFNSGAHIAAVKMLRLETGCNLSEAVEVLKAGTVPDMPAFKALRARRKAERYGPQLLAMLKETQVNIGGDWRDRRDDLIAEIEKE